MRLVIVELLYCLQVKFQPDLTPTQSSVTATFPIHSHVKSCWWGQIFLESQITELLKSSQWYSTYLNCTSTLQTHNEASKSSTWTVCSASACPTTSIQIFKKKKGDHVPSSVPIKLHSWGMSQHLNSLKMHSLKTYTLVLTCISQIAAFNSYAYSEVCT